MNLQSTLFGSLQAILWVRWGDSYKVWNLSAHLSLLLPKLLVWTVYDLSIFRYNNLELLNTFLQVITSCATSEHIFSGTLCPLQFFLSDLFPFLLQLHTPLNILLDIGFHLFIVPICLDCLDQHFKLGLRSLQSFYAARLRPQSFRTMIFGTVGILGFI